MVVAALEGRTVSFTKLQPTCANHRRSLVPDYGIRVFVTGRMATGPKAKGGYTALQIGRHLATTLGLTRAKQSIGISIGSGEDAGRISVYVDEDGGFAGKKQVNGTYVFALGYHSTKDIFAVQFEPFTIEQVKVDGVERAAIINIPAEARP